MARQTEELLGEFDYVQRQYAASDGQVKIMPGRLVDGTQVIGYVKEDCLETGMTYLFRGFWSHHPKYGPQFMFSSVGLSQPDGQRGTVNYLQRAPGFGAKRAHRAWELWGKDALETVREKPQEVAAAIGMTEQLATEAAAWLKAHLYQEQVQRDLEELGLGRRQIDWAISKYGAAAAETIRENAFVLMACWGVGFLKADKLYLELGGDPAADERLAWCAWNELHREREGSTWSRSEICTKAIVQSVVGGGVEPARGIQHGIDTGFISRRTIDGQTWLSESDRAAAEMRLASHVYRAIQEKEMTV